MEFREWALITFTILAQMSVGSFIALGIAHFYASRKAGEVEADRFSDRALLAIGPVMALGLLASLLHLGNPINAYRAVTNIGTSWLSREVLFGVLFAVFGFAFAILQWRKIGNFKMRNVIAIIAAIFGIGLVYSMSQVYALPTQPAWNTIATPISFFATTLLLGALALGTAFVINYAYIKAKNPEGSEAQSGLLRGALRWIAIATVVLLGVELVVLPLHIGSLSASGSKFAMESNNILFGQFGIIFALRLILVFVGAGVFGIFLYQNATSPGKEKVMASFVYGAFIMVLIAEIIGRFLFFATQSQIVI
jgi:anaerobic dimethyl sulfoxide reductase subunit C